MKNTYSKREMQVITGLISGKRQQEVASDIGITPCCLATYMNRIRKKLGIYGKEDNMIIVLLESVRRGYIPIKMLKLEQYESP